MFTIKMAYPAMLVLLLSLPASAQTFSSNWDSVRAIAKNTEVRILADNGPRIHGSLEGTTDIAVIMSTGANTIGRPQIASVSVRKNGHRVRNSLIGVGVGLVAGIGIGVATASSCQGEICGIAAAGRIGLTGALGMVAGGVAGVAWPTGGWREVYRR
jgi:hypothetical protein